MKPLNRPAESVTTLVSPPDGVGAVQSGANSRVCTRAPVAEPPDASLTAPVTITWSGPGSMITVPEGELHPAAITSPAYRARRTAFGARCSRAVTLDSCSRSVTVGWRGPSQETLHGSRISGEHEMESCRVDRR